MAERQIDPRLKEIYDSGVPVYSISRIDTINNCLAEARKTYILHEKGRDNIYGVLGTRMHETLENIINNKATEEDLLPAMNAELDDMDMVGINFPKDFSGGDSIRTGWIENMKHFCKNYTAPENKSDFKTEELFIYKTPKGRYFIGYIDLQEYITEKEIRIFDYKTSSMYAGEELKKHGRQLVIYSMAKEQEGYTVKDASWIFLKYVDVSFMGKKTVKSKEKTLINKTIERRKIGQELAKYVEQDLYEAGYDDFESQFIIDELKSTNDMSCVPEDIRKNYNITDCCYTYDITEDVKNECIDYIESTIDMWESMNSEDEKSYIPRGFTRTNKSGKVSSDVFYCTSLCSHFNTCNYIHDYLDQQTYEEDII